MSYSHPREGGRGQEGGTLDNQLRHYLGRKAGIDEATRTHRMPCSEELSTSQVADAKQAESLLAEFTENSHYAVLQDQLRAFFLVIDDVTRERPQSPISMARAARRATTALHNVLSSQRAFDDATSHAISCRYGKASEAYRTFKTALSEEYDNEVAYRLTYKLRNCVQHCASVLKLELTLKGSAGATEAVLVPMLSSHDLLARYQEWGQLVRRDLTEIDGVIRVDELLDLMMQCCSRAYARLILSVRKELEAAAASLIDLDMRAPEKESNGYPLIVSLFDPPIAGRGPSWSYVRADLAHHVVDELLVECEAAALQ